VTGPHVRCIGEPVSFLALEAYALDELPPEAAEPVRAHLAACEACRAALREIEDDQRPLPAFVPRAAPSTSKAPRGRLRLLRIGAPAVAAMALAAGVLLMMRSGGDHGDHRTKGREVSLRVEGEDPAYEAGTLAVGVALKVVVACPPDLHASWDVVVFDEDGASFPLSPARITCENQAALPGAMRLRGVSDKRVCVVWDESAVPSTRVGYRRELDLPPERSRCITVRAVPR